MNKKRNKLLVLMIAVCLMTACGANGEVNRTESRESEAEETQMQETEMYKIIPNNMIGVKAITKSQTCQLSRRNFFSFSGNNPYSKRPVE